MAIGYDSSAKAEQTNNVSIDQSAVQIAGAGGNGGNSDVGTGSDAGFHSGSGVVSTGGDSAGNGGDGHFSRTLLDAPVVVYHPINIAKAVAGGAADASQSNAVEIDQSAIQIAGVGDHGGNGNAAIGGNPSAHGSVSDDGIGAGMIQAAGRPGRKRRRRRALWRSRPCLFHAL